MSEISALPATDNAILWRSFKRHPSAVAAAGLVTLIGLGALLAPVLAPQNPFDPASLDLANSLLPPAWREDGDARFLLGSDDQGRDMLSALLYGSRVSLLVGIAAVAFAAILGSPFRPSSLR
jgi:peptide/nickel transport system permease protein